MNSFEVAAHLEDKHGFPVQRLQHDGDALREIHAKEHLHGGYYENLHHTETSR